MATIMQYHATDTPAVVIGASTQDGRRIPPPPIQHTIMKQPRPQPEGNIKVIVHGHVVREIEKATLIRFSRVAAAAFPPPGTTTITSPDPQATTLILHDARFWDQPSADAIRHVLDWMDRVKSTHRHAQVPPFELADQYDFGEHGMVDSFAAALILDIRPAPRQARDELMAYISKTPPSFDLLRAVHELLPAHDPAMRRLITSYWEHLDRGNYADVKEEDTAIRTYVKDPDVDPHLHVRFREIQKSFEGKKGGKMTNGANYNVARGAKGVNVNGGAKQGMAKGVVKAGRNHVEKHSIVKDGEINMAGADDGEQLPTEILGSKAHAMAEAGGVGEQDTAGDDASETDGEGTTKVGWKPGEKGGKASRRSRDNAKKHKAIEANKKVVGAP